MWASIGFQRTMKTIANFPAIVLTPAFSYWVFGPFSCPTWCRGGNSNLGVSFLHTWINAGLTVYGQLMFVTIVFLNSNGDSIYKMFAVYSLPCHILSIIMLILLQCLQKCNCCTSSCCESITQRTLLNVDNPLEKIEFQQRVSEEEHEMQVQML